MADPTDPPPDIPPAQVAARIRALEQYVADHPEGTKVAFSTLKAIDPSERTAVQVIDVAGGKVVHVNPVGITAVVLLLSAALYLAIRRLRQRRL